MAAAWCLPRNLTNAFLDALKGDLAPDRLMSMSSAERREAFGKILGDDNAREVNAQFESKLLLRDQKAGLLNWAKKIGGLTEPARRDIISTIERMEKVLQPEDEHAFLADLAAKRLGTDVTAGEAQTIFQLAQKAQAAKIAATDSFSGASNDFLNATEDLKSYISSLKPVSAAKSIGLNAVVVARNNLLFNPSTPIKTMIGQAENAAIETVVRRIGNMSLNGLNSDIAKAARSEAWETYRRTGLNVAGMESLNDSGRLGEGRRFDIQGGSASDNALLRVAQQGMQRAAAISNKVIIDWAHVAPFTRVYQQAFYDMANIVSSNLAKGEGLISEAARVRAEEIFRDAAKIVPETQEGATVRKISQEQSARVTSTNDTVASRLAMGIKDGLNKSVYGLGDALMPVAKIPANIVWNGIENAGVGIPLGVRDIFAGRQKIQSADMATRYEGMGQYAKGIQTVARTFGTLGVAAYFASQMQPGDFRQDHFGQSYVKIGDVWINMEYISAISPALAGAMTAKMKATPGESARMKVANYISGAAAPLAEAPGVNELSELVRNIRDMGRVQGFQKYASTFFSSRAVPSFISNMLSGRPIERLFFGAHGIETDNDVRTDKIDRAMNKGPDGMSLWGEPVGRDTNSDPVNRELEQLNYAPSFPMRKIRGVPLTDAQYSSYVQISGRLAHMRLTETVGMPGWDTIPTQARLNAVQSIMEDSRNMAQTTLMLQYPNIRQKANDAKTARMAQAGPVPVS